MTNETAAEATVGVASTVLYVFLVRVGFILVHVGCVPTTNVSYVYMQHLLNLAVGTLSYFCLGRVVAEGEDWAGLIGVSGWSNWGKEESVKLWGWVMYAAGLGELVTAGRVHLLGGVIATTLLTGLIHPTVIHQVWHNGWMSDGLRDTAGGVVVHLYGGATAFGALLAFGQRIFELKQLDKASLSADSQSASVLGYFLVIASTIQMTSGAGVLSLIYCASAVSIGIIMTTLFYKITCHGIDHWVVVWVLQGGLSALVATSSGLLVFNFLLILLSSLLGTVAFALFCCLIRMTGLEDYANILAVHLIPGAISTYLASFNAEGYLIGINPDTLLWQALCSLIIFCSSSFLSLAIYIILNFLKLLRNPAEQSVHDLTHEINPRCCPFFRKFNPSLGNMIRPGFHSIFHMKRRSKRKRNSLKQNEHRGSAEFEDIILDNNEIPTTSNRIAY